MRHIRCSLHRPATGATSPIRNTGRLAAVMVWGASHQPKASFARFTMQPAGGSGVTCLISNLGKALSGGNALIGGHPDYSLSRRIGLWLSIHAGGFWSYVPCPPPCAHLLGRVRRLTLPILSKETGHEPFASIARMIIAYCRAKGVSLTQTATILGTAWHETARFRYMREI